MTQQVTLRELLSDPLYRKWFSKPPKLKVSTNTPPWRLYAQKEEGGKWARGDFPTYVAAYNGVRVRLSEYHDLLIHSKPQPFRPPVVRIEETKFWYPCPDGHLWCVYCRRPTVFGYFTRHPAMRHPLSSEELRCGICAARAAGMPEFRTRLTWPVGTGGE